MKTALSVAVAALLGVGNAQNPSQVLTSTYTGSAGLHDAAKAQGKYMGTASDLYFASGIDSDAPYMAEFKNAADWGAVTPGNLMKWQFIEPQKGVFDYSSADQFIAMAKSQGKLVRCHTLLWHQENPDWLQNGQWTNATLLDVLTNHITNVMTHFKDDCYAWDVVNEVVDDNGGYRDSFWHQVTGSSYIAHAFNVANDVKTKLGLKVKLYYNDYSIEWAGGAKTTFAQQMVKGLVNQGVKIDGVGMQSHFTIGGTPSKDSLMSIMSVYTSLGLDVAITELDIRTQMPPSMDTQKQQVTDYASVIGACKDTAKCVGVTIWDFDDNYSWVPGTFSGYGWALPWYQPNGKGTALVRKGCYDGIINAWGVPSGPTSTPSTPPVSNTPTSSPSSTPTPTPTPSSTPTPTPSTTTTGAKKWGQCGGINWQGPTTCSEGSCTKLNDWYYQCL